MTVVTLGGAKRDAGLWTSNSSRPYLVSPSLFDLIFSLECFQFTSMEYDTDKIDEAVLALLYLTLHDVSEFGGRAWKGHDFRAMDRLHEKNLISDPRSKAKSVVLDASGIKAAEKAFRKLFGKN